MKEPVQMPPQASACEIEKRKPLKSRVLHEGQMGGK